MKIALVTLAACVAACTPAPPLYNLEMTTNGNVYVIDLDLTADDCAKEARDLPRPLVARCVPEERN